MVPWVPPSLLPGFTVSGELTTTRATWMRKATIRSIRRNLEICMGLGRVMFTDVQDSFKGGPLKTTITNGQPGGWDDCWWDAQQMRIPNRADSVSGAEDVTGSLCLDPLLTSCFGLDYQDNPQGLTYWDSGLGQCGFYNAGTGQCFNCYTCEGETEGNYIPSPFLLKKSYITQPRDVVAYLCTVFPKASVPGWTPIVSKWNLAGGVIDGSSVAPVIDPAFALRVSHIEQLRLIITDLYVIIEDLVDGSGTCDLRQRSTDWIDTWDMQGSVSLQTALEVSPPDMETMPIGVLLVQSVQPPEVLLETGSFIQFRQELDSWIIPLDVSPVAVNLRQGLLADIPEWDASCIVDMRQHIDDIVVLDGSSIATVRQRLRVPINYTNILNINMRHQLDVPLLFDVGMGSVNLKQILGDEYLAVSGVAYIDFVQALESEIVRDGTAGVELLDRLDVEEELSGFAFTNLVQQVLDILLLDGMTSVDLRQTLDVPGSFDGKGSMLLVQSVLDQIEMAVSAVASLVQKLDTAVDMDASSPANLRQTAAEATVLVANAYLNLRDRTAGEQILPAKSFVVLRNELKELEDIAGLGTIALKDKLDVVIAYTAYGIGNLRQRLLPATSIVEEPSNAAVWVNGSVLIGD